MDEKAPPVITWLGNLSRRRQWILAMGGTSIILILLVGSFLVLRPKYQVLFRDLKPQDASAIVAKLEKEKIPYEIDESSSAILVQENDARATRLKLMSGDLRLQGVVGMELFNNSDLGLTDFAQKVNYQRALQGELARTIMALDEVDMARVHLTLPESSIFKRDQVRPKASIALFMRDGHQLTTDGIRGIQRLVASSVPDMKPSDVTVLDQRGNPATSKGNDVDDPQFALKQAVESYYEQKVIAQVGPNIGERHVTVSVNADINFDQTRITRESDSNRPIDSAKNPLASQETPVLSRDNLKVALPPLPQSTTATATQTNRTIEQIVSAPGSIRRLSVGVAFDKPLASDDNSKLSALISASIGLDTKRGDVLSIFVSPSNQLVNVESKTSDSQSTTPKLPTPPPSAPVTMDDPSASATHFPWILFLAIAGLLLLSALTLMLFVYRIRRNHSVDRRLTENERNALAIRLQKLLHDPDDAYVK